MITPVNEQTHVRMIPNLIGALGKIEGRPMIRYDLDFFGRLHRTQIRRGTKAARRTPKQLGQGHKVIQRIH